MNFFNKSRWTLALPVLAVLALIASVSAAGVTEGAAAPDVSFKTLQGNTVSLYAYTCSKPTLLWFTNFGKASVSALPEIAKVHNRYRDKGLALVIISLKGRDTETPGSFAHQYSLAGSVFLDPDGYACYQMAGEYLEGTLPSNNLFILDGHKVVSAVRHFPGLPYSALESEIERVLE